jgi:two-component system sensor kinase FixL
VRSIAESSNPKPMKYRAAMLAGGFWLGMTVLPALGAIPKRVLIIHSFGPTAPPFTTHSTAFETTLTEEMGELVDLDEASLDMGRYGQPDMQDSFADFIKDRLAKWQPDLVVPIGSPAGRFVAQYRIQLFPHMPILYAAMDRRTLPADVLETNAAYVGQVFDVAGLGEDMLQVAPDTTNLVIVVGASPLEQFWVEMFRRGFEPFTNRVSLTFLNDLTFDQMLERTAKLPPRSFIFLGLLVRDASGVTINEDNALQRLRATANAPINGIFRNQLGLGIVGGRLYEAENVGAEAARVAIRILHGEPASSIPPRIVPPGRPRYDWRELQRWNISENRLPPGSLIEFRRPTVWERYRWWLLAILVVTVAEAGLIVLLVTNLSTRRRVEEQLRESEARFRIIADSVPVLIWMSGADKLSTFFNKAWLDFTGRTVEQEMGNGWTERVHPEDSATCLKTYRESFEARQPFTMQYRLRRHDDEYRWLTNHGVPRFDTRGNFSGYIGSCIDITEQRLAEERLRLDAAVIENMTDGVVVVRNRDQRIVHTNPTFDRLVGYQPGELIGQHIDVINFGEDSNPPAITKTISQTLRATGRWSGEVLNRRKDGSTVWCRISITTFEHPVFGDIGVSIHTDITAQRQNEEEMQRLRLEAWHADRVARTGAITASLAHELNQPLAAILNNSQAALRFLATGPPDLGEIREILEDIVRDDKRAGAVVSGLRAMLRRQQSQRERIDLPKAIQETMDLLHSELLTHHVDVSVRAEPGCVVLADKTQVQQVILNLVMNSIEAMESLPARERRLELAVTRSAPDAVQVTVRDNGPGIPQEYVEKLFEAFWSTKPQGLGIGLAICRSILESHGGHIWLANNQPRETALCFTLPADG